ncbi:MAG: hypothetical protein P8X68_16000, partial [Desulfobacterales bacterium]
NFDVPVNQVRTDSVELKFFRETPCQGSKCLSKSRIPVKTGNAGHGGQSFREVKIAQRCLASLPL